MTNAFGLTLEQITAIKDEFMAKKKEAHPIVVFTPEELIEAGAQALLSKLQDVTDEKLVNKVSAIIKVSAKADVCDKFGMGCSDEKCVNSACWKIEAYLIVKELSAVHKVQTQQAVEKAYKQGYHDRALGIVQQEALNEQ